MSAAVPVLPPVLDLAGTAVFAITGALLAARLRQTFVTCAFFALVTGVGGGTVRDLLIGVPVFWVRDPWVAPLCLAVALLAWFTPPRDCGKASCSNGWTPRGSPLTRRWARPKRWRSPFRRCRRS